MLSLVESEVKLVIAVERYDADMGFCGMTTALLRYRGVEDEESKKGNVDFPEFDHETANVFVVAETVDPYSTTIE